VVGQKNNYEGTPLELGRKTQIAIKLFGYAFGYAGIAYETLLAEEVNLALLGVFTAMIGLPLALGIDLKRAGRK
jgi:hypothetical protein